jgi:hypothetical protein
MSSGLNRCGSRRRAIARDGRERENSVPRMSDMAKLLRVVPAHAVLSWSLTSTGLVRFTVSLNNALVVDALTGVDREMRSVQAPCWWVRNESPMTRHPQPA